MKRVININIFDKKSIDDAVSEVERLSKNLDLFEQKLEDAIQRTTVVIDNCYASATATKWGSGVFPVSYRKTENGYTIFVYGKDVAFVEFGAGVYYNGAESYKGERPEGIVGIGQYGKGLGSNPNWRWIEDGLPVDTTATNGMYEGLKFLENEVNNICKELFK